MDRWFIAARIVPIALGIILKFAPWMSSRFGRPPDDFRFETSRNRIGVPAMSMILIGVLVPPNLFKR